jgi:hypothetical protein
MNMTFLIYAGLAFWVLALILHWIPDPAPQEGVSTLTRVRESAFILGFLAIGVTLAVR